MSDTPTSSPTQEPSPTPEPSSTPPPEEPSTPPAEPSSTPPEEPSSAPPSSDPPSSDPGPTPSSDPPPQEPSQEPSSDPGGGEPSTPISSRPPEPSAPSDPTKPGSASPQPTASPTKKPSDSPTPTEQGSEVQTTVFSTTIIVTGTDGSQYSTIIETQSVIGDAYPTGDASNKGTPTGAIAGGVVGGILGLALLGLLTWFLLRRAKQRRIEKDFDGDFDPARFARPASYGPGVSGAAGGATLPVMGVTDEDDGMSGRLNASVVGGGVVSPYGVYQSTQGSTSPRRASIGTTGPPMSQHSHNDASTTSSGYNPYNPYQGTLPQTAMPTPAMAGVAAARYAQGSVSDGSRTNSSHHGSRYNVANPDARPLSPDEHAAYLKSGPSTRNASHTVLVHQDGGRLESAQDSSPTEIPPTYDSLLAASGIEAPSQRPPEKF